MSTLSLLVLSLHLSILISPSYRLSLLLSLLAPPLSQFSVSLPLISLHTSLLVSVSLSVLTFLNSFSLYRFTFLKALSVSLSISYGFTLSLSLSLSSRFHMLTSFPLSLLFLSLPLSAILWHHPTRGLRNSMRNHHSKS